MRGALSPCFQMVMSSKLARTAFIVHFSSVSLNNLAALTV